MFKYKTYPISHGNAPNFDDPPKTGNYTTPEEIGEMRELQQVTTTVPDAAKKCRFYRVELLNEGKYRTRGEVPPDRRKRGKNGMCSGGGEVGLKRVGNREREEKKKESA